MKRFLVSLSAFLALTSSSIIADDLKNSLMPTASKAEKPMVNLDNLNVGAKVGPRVQHKSRSGKAVIATVNGIKIYKRDADKFLKLATKGKVSDLDKLSKKHQKDVIKNLASTALIEAKAKKEVTQKEKNKLAAQYWMGKKLKKIKVSDGEAKKFYKANKKAFKGKNGKLVPFEKVKNYISMNIKQQKLIKKLMKSAKIVIK
jgi:hypothetical protein